MVAAGAAGAAGGDATYVDDVFSTFLYEGNSSTQAINNGIDLSGEGGLVWMKERSGSGFDHHILVDTIRGRLKALKSNLTSEEASSSDPYPFISSFNTNGFTAGYNNSNNYSAADYVSWTFRKAPGFFDIQTWTGNDVAGRTISHNLGSVPGMILVKRLNDSDNWVVYHRSLGATHPAILNTADKAEPITNRWNDTEPTSTEFTLGTWPTNELNKTFIAYIFAHDDQSFGTDSDESIIKCGSYTGSGSDGNFVNVGFEPQWLMIKNTSSSSTNWLITDVMRGMPVHGGTTKVLSPNSDAVETTQVNIAPNPTGFTLAGSGSYSNQSGNTFIYMAICRPHKPPTAATEVFDIAAASSYPTSSIIPCNFTPDFFFARSRSSGSSIYAEPRLSDKWLYTHSTNGEDSANYFEWDSPGGKVNLPTTAYNSNPIFYQFRRAPGFFDVVTYTGGVTNQSINHNLGVKPDFIITKARNNSTINWICYHSSLTASNFIRLNTDQDRSTSGGLAWNSTEPTSTQFTLGNAAWDGTNYNGTNYIAYLFASLDGISKVGSYTGTGSNINVDCGFAAGARFVMIKRYDAGSSGNWCVWDTTRGISSGVDPFFQIDNAAEYTNTDYIDPLNEGFTVTSSASANAGINASGGEYIFLAIA
tara:strand:+ start:5 stop:1942 length:1938 start_codon:yes stop_codon:yes gene_type:complete